MDTPTFFFGLVINYPYLYLMIGYWKGGRTPFTTTGNNFLENFNFFTPITGGLIWALIIGVPIVMLYNIISPSTKYEFKDFHHKLSIVYQTDGDEVTGKIAYYWDQNDGLYSIDTKFKGKINGNNLIIELEDNNIKRCFQSTGTVSKNMSLGIEGDKIYFQDVIAKKI